MHEVKYYESHITIEPVFDERLELFRELCKDHDFRAADLLMQTSRKEQPSRSNKDSFCTGRGKDFHGLSVRMLRLVAKLEDHDYVVWRQKIEAVILDERFEHTEG